MRAPKASDDEGWFERTIETGTESGARDSLAAQFARQEGSSPGPTPGESYAERFTEYWKLPEGLRGEAERLSHDIHLSDELLADRNYRNFVASSAYDLQMWEDAELRDNPEMRQGDWSELDLKQRISDNYEEYGQTSSETAASGWTAWSTDKAGNKVTWEDQQAAYEARADEDQSISEFLEENYTNHQEQHRVEETLSEDIRAVWADNDVFGFAHAASDVIERAQDAEPAQNAEGSEGGQSGDTGPTSRTLDVTSLDAATRAITSAVDELQIAMGAVGGAEEIPGAIGRTAERAAENDGAARAQMLEVTNLLATTFYDMTITCTRIGTAMASVVQGLESERENYVNADQVVADTFESNRIA